MNGVVSYNVPHFFGEGALIPWGMLIVLHFFLSGLAGGSFLISAAATHFGDERHGKIASVGAYLALIPIIIDVPVLILDLDRPMRFITLLFRGSITAPLTWGVWFLIGLGVFSLLNILLQKGIAGAKSAKGLILALGSICAIGVMVYTAIALNIATNARPLWSDGIIIPIFMAASITSGIAAITFVISVSGGSPGLKTLNTANAVLLPMQLLMVTSLVLTASTANPLSREAAGMLLKGGLAFMFWGGLVVIGLVIPILALWSDVLSRKSEPGAGTAALISLMVLVGVFALRYIIVYGGQIIPLT